MKIGKRMISIAGAVCLCMAFVPAYAAEYTYTVTFFSGARGDFQSDAIQVQGSDYQIEQNEDMIRLTGLHDGAVISFQPEVVKIHEEDQKYYMRGIRESGRDNDTIGTGAIILKDGSAYDKDYVAAYGIKTEVVSYTVHFKDENGKTLAESRTYYGNVGDKSVASYLYIEGYQPQAYNLTRTLSKNAAQNEFVFTYRKMTASENQNNTTTGSTAANNNTSIETTKPSAGSTTDRTQAVTSPASSGNTYNGNSSKISNAGEDNSNTNEQNNRPTNGIDTNNTMEQPESPTDDAVIIDENEASEQDLPEELIDLDDEETPLAAYDDTAEKEAAAQEKEQMQWKIILFCGIVGLLAAIVGITAYVMKKKRREENE